jgi:hypothetical protein
MLRRFVVPLCLILLCSSVITSEQSGSESLRATEYGTVGLIFNEELSALGAKALYPICVDAPKDAPLKSLVSYLRKASYPISDLRLCVPNLAPIREHPKDYPHGMQIFIDNPHRDLKGQVDIHVETTDLTTRPGEHLTLVLRRGTYHFKSKETGAWEMTGYTKEYESRDGNPNCVAAQSSTSSK